MVNKTISIPYQLNERLKSEFNASELITILLTNHYKQTEKPKKEDPEQSLKELEEKREQVLKELQQEEKSLITKKEIKIKEIEEEEQRRELSQKNREERDNRIKVTFFEETGQDMPEGLLEEYFHQSKNIYQFMIDRGFIKQDGDEDIQSESRME